MPAVGALRGVGGVARTALVALLLLLALTASPALAAVVDLQSGWAPGEVRALQEALDAIRADDFVVVLVARAPADGLDGEAARQFTARALGPREAVLVVDGQAKQLGVHLGESFRAEGIAGETLRNRIEVAFVRAAAEERGRAGVAELVRQLKVLRATGGAAPFRMPWGALALGVGALAALAGVRRLRRGIDRRDALRDRLALVRISAGRATAARAGLAALIGARGRSGEAAVMAARLLRLGEAAATEATAVAEAVRMAEGALATGREAEVAHAALAFEQRAFLAEAALAAACSAARLLDEAADPAAALALVAQAEAAARDWQTVRAAIAWLAEQPGTSTVSTNVRERHLRVARAELTDVPVELDEARTGLALIAAQLAGVRVQRVAAGARPADALWDLAPARYLVSAAAETLTLG